MPSRAGSRLLVVSRCDISRFFTEGTHLSISAPQTLVPLRVKIDDGNNNDTSLYEYFAIVFAPPCDPKESISQTSSDAPGRLCCQSSPLLHRLHLSQCRLRFGVVAWVGLQLR